MTAADAPHAAPEIDRLKAYLSRELKVRPDVDFALGWIAACAAYPAPRWAFTLFLGEALAKAHRRRWPDEALLLIVGRLPWFREGRMPAPLRLALLRELSAGNRRLVRRSLADLILSAMADKAPLAGRRAPARDRPRQAARALERLPADAVQADPLLWLTLRGWPLWPGLIGLARRLFRAPRPVRALLAGRWLGAAGVAAVAAGSAFLLSDWMLSRTPLPEKPTQVRIARIQLSACGAYDSRQPILVLQTGDVVDLARLKRPIELEPGPGDGHFSRILLLPGSLTLLTQGPGPLVRLWRQGAPPVTLSRAQGLVRAGMDATNQLIWVQVSDKGSDIIRQWTLRDGLPAKVDDMAFAGATSGSDDFLGEDGRGLLNARVVSKTVKLTDSRASEPYIEPLGPEVAGVGFAGRDLVILSCDPKALVSGKAQTAVSTPKIDSVQPDESKAELTILSPWRETECGVPGGSARDFTVIFPNGEGTLSDQGQTKVREAAEYALENEGCIQIRGYAGIREFTSPGNQDLSFAGGRARSIARRRATATEGALPSPMNRDRISVGWEISYTGAPDSSSPDHVDRAAVLKVWTWQPVPAFGQRDWGNQNCRVTGARLQTVEIDFLPGYIGPPEGVGKDTVIRRTATGEPTCLLLKVEIDLGEFGNDRLRALNAGRQRAEELEKAYGYPSEDVQLQWAVVIFGTISATPRSSAKLEILAPS